MVMADFTTKASQLEQTGTPLRLFRAHLKDVTPRMEKPRGSGDARTVVDLDFVGIKVLEVVGQYNYPVARITVNYSKRDRSGWGMLLKSAERFGFDDLNDLRGGHEITVRVNPEYVYQAQVGEPGADGYREAIKGMVLTITEVDGKGTPAMPGAVAATSEDQAQVDAAHLLDGLHGKTAGDFANWALQDQVGRRFQKEIFDDTLIPGMVAAGLVIKEGDRLWVVGRER